MSITWGVVTVATLAAALFSATSQGNRQSATQRDSAGIRIISNAASSTTTIRVDTHPLYQIGFRDNDYIFERIEGATLLSDGGAVIANTGSVQELAVFSPAGSLLRKLGRKGQGPGEFQQVRDPLVIGTDTIVVPIRVVRNS